jgi:hypothetical protein
VAAAAAAPRATTTMGNCCSGPPKPLSRDTPTSRFLESLRLGHYCVAVHDQGYAFLSDFLNASGQDIHALTVTVGMLTPEAKRLFKRLTDYEAAAAAGASGHLLERTRTPARPPQPGAQLTRTQTPSRLVVGDGAILSRQYTPAR